MKNVFNDHFNSSGGFTLLEVLVAMIVFSLGLMALSSLSVALIGGNSTSRRYLEAATKAQGLLEGLRFKGFNLGADATLGTADDVISDELTNPVTANDATSTSVATMFTTPDHAMDGVIINDASGRLAFVENATLLNSPTLTLGYYPRAAWVVRDNYPVAGMKTVTVVVGWLEGSAVPHYLSLSTALQETK